MLCGKGNPRVIGELLYTNADAVILLVTLGNNSIKLLLNLNLAARVLYLLCPGKILA